MNLKSWRSTQALWQQYM